MRPFVSPSDRQAAAGSVRHLAIGTSTDLGYRSELSESKELTKSCYQVTQYVQGRSVSFVLSTQGMGGKKEGRWRDDGLWAARRRARG